MSLIKYSIILVHNQHIALPPEFQVSSRRLQYIVLLFLLVLTQVCRLRRCYLPSSDDHNCILDTSIIELNFTTIHNAHDENRAVIIPNMAHIPVPFKIFVSLSWNNHTDLLVKNLSKACCIIRHVKTYMSAPLLKMNYSPFFTVI